MVFHQQNPLHLRSDHVLELGLTEIIDAPAALRGGLSGAAAHSWNPVVEVQ